MSTADSIHDTSAKCWVPLSVAVYILPEAEKRSLYNIITRLFSGQITFPNINPSGVSSGPYHLSHLCPIHTADAEATKLSSCVVSAVWTHPSAVVTQFTIAVLTTDKWRHNDVIVEKIVKIHEYYTTQTQQIRMFTNVQRHMLRHILLLLAIALAAEL